MNEDVTALKDTLENPNTRKSKSRRIITEKFEKVLSLKLFCMCMKLKSRYDKQVTKKKNKTKTKQTRLWALFVTRDIYRWSNGMTYLQLVFEENALVRLNSFSFFFSFITLKGRLPVKWTAYEALLYGVYTTQSDVWVVNIIWHLKLPCPFFVNYKCSHLPFLSICSWSYGILLYEILTVGKRGLKEKHTQYCLKKTVK